METSWAMEGDGENQTAAAAGRRDGDRGPGRKRLRTGECSGEGWTGPGEPPLGLAPGLVTGVCSTCVWAAGDGPAPPCPVSVGAAGAAGPKEGVPAGAGQQS